MTKKEWAIKRAELRKHLRRSEISDAAFRLWDELATGWAWQDPSCFPSIRALAMALRKHRNKITLLLNELVEHDLLIRKRRFRGYRFTLVTEIPERFLDPDINTNKSLRKSKKQREALAKDMHPDPGMGEHASEKSCTHQKQEYAPDPGHENDSHAPDPGHSHAPDPGHVIEAVQEEAIQLRGNLERKRRKRGSEIHASQTEGGTMLEPSRCALGNEGTTGSECVPENLGDLIEDPWGGKTPKKFQHRKRSPDPTFVPGAGRPKKAFPEATGGSQSHEHTRFDPGASAMPVESPDGLLCRLEGEIKERWGINATRGFPMELTVVQRGKFKNAIIRKYPPDVIESMVCLLVWDWEVARGACFPFRRDQRYPCVDSLAQYAKDLAARVESGFDYPTESRGALNTYKDLFIDKRELVEDDDPF